MSKKTRSVLFRFPALAVVLLLVVLLSACSGGGGSGADPAGAAVETYLQAIVEANPDGAAMASCADWESSARDEVASFMGVKAWLENVDCKSESTASGTATVGCTGAIVATYNNENQSFDLEGRKFNVVERDGEWLVCGYGE